MERDATPNEPQGLQAMTTLSLGQAAKLAGVGKTTISRAITAGRLSATVSYTHLTLPTTPYV